MQNGDKTIKLFTMTSEEENKFAQAQRIMQGITNHGINAPEDIQMTTSDPDRNFEDDQESSMSIHLPESIRASPKKKPGRSQTFQATRASHQRSIILQKTILEREIEAELERQNAHAAQQVNYTKI